MTKQKSTDPATGRGVAQLAAPGLRIFVDMVATLSGQEPELSDQFYLAEESRPGMAFRNLVAEYLAQAERLGPDAVAGFCACLTDYLYASIAGAPEGVFHYYAYGEARSHLAPALSGRQAPAAAKEA